MRDTQRPVCHRAEDLVTYLYGEAGAADAFDFRNHLQRCDACRSEFAAFNQVHESIGVWRDEALGASFSTAAAAEPVIDSTQFVRHERKLSAWAALREFFSVSPLWLRGATAFAALLLLVLSAAMVSRTARKPADVATASAEPTYTKEQVQAEVNKAVAQTRAELLASQQTAPPSPAAGKDEPRPANKHIEVAVDHAKPVRPRGLNRQEREQLAADLRLTTPADEDELLMALPERDNPR